MDRASSHIHIHRDRLAHPRYLLYLMSYYTGRLFCKYKDWEKKAVQSIDSRSNSAVDRTSLNIHIHYDRLSHARCLLYLISCYLLYSLSVLEIQGFRKSTVLPVDRRSKLRDGPHIIAYSCSPQLPVSCWMSSMRDELVYCSSVL